MENIIDQLIGHGMTTEEIAAAVQCSNPAIRKWKKKMTKRKIYISALNKLLAKKEREDPSLKNVEDPTAD